MNTEQISLYYREGSSDKVYHVQLAQEGEDAYVVNVQYGRRGSALASLTKTASPIPLAKAKKIYEKLVAEKTSKGYTTGKDGTPYQGTEKAGDVSGFVPQLLNAITQSEAQECILSNLIVAQEKMNGERRLLQRVSANDVRGINRKGLVVVLPDPLAKAAGRTDISFAQFVLDGEAIGDVLHVFDALEANGNSLKELPYLERFEHAFSIVEEIGSEYVQIVPVAVSAAEKTALFKSVQRKNGEGVVFKEKSAPYTAGRPASGGSQLKHKFVQSATCVVEKANEGKRSVALLLKDDAAGDMVSVGNVTIPANAVIPKKGDICEVQYLYAYKGGSLFQPVFIGKRTDVGIEACTLAQLKYIDTAGR